MGGHALNDTTAPLSAAERQRELRRRRKNKLRLVQVEVFEEEIAALVKSGAIPEDATSNADSVAYGVGLLIGRAISALNSGALPGTFDASNL
jgi:hypothetical protein